MRIGSATDPSKGTWLDSGLAGAGQAVAACVRAKLAVLRATRVAAEADVTAAAATTDGGAAAAAATPAPGADRRPPAPA